MKILLVNDYLEKIGGAEVYLWSLKEELEKKGHTVKLFGTDITERKYILSQQRKSISRYINQLFNYSMYRTFDKVVSDFRPDIIHVHNILNELSPSILLAVREIPVVITVHDNRLVNAVSILSARTGKDCKNRTCHGCSNCVGPLGAIYENIKFVIRKLLLSKVKLYITPSEYMADLIKESKIKPVTVVPNGINKVSYAEITQFTNLLYVGRITIEKGVEILVRSLAQIIKGKPKTHLTLIGDGEDVDKINKLIADLKLNQNITLTGPLKKKEIEPFYKQSTLVVIPSLMPDNFPTVCIEAMSHGRPVVANNIGGLPELVDNDETGLLIQSISTQSLTDVVVRLLSDKNKIVAMSKSAHIRSKKYSMSHHISNIENQYHKLINKK